ncbi:MAG: D-glycerate dehydrogenase [Acidimicrobiaceae bacterium]|nr:D-glycerate dehydrogenase [Acidimicrobiaceae bacterium]
MPRIVVTGKIPEAALALLRRAGDVWAWSDDRTIPDAERDDQLADADAAVTLLTDRVDEAFLHAAPRLRVVANVAVGYDNVDVAACTARGVTVTNTPGVLTDATADLAMALVLMSTRRLGEGERLIRSGRPWQWGMFMMLGRSIGGKRLGIVGMGEIGRAVARRAAAFGMEIAYHNRTQLGAEVERELGARYVPLDELLATSDVVSLHCPHTSETHHLIDAVALERMSSHAVLINTARGPVVDEIALARVLADGTIAAAGLDVYEDEPRVHPELLELENVVLIPHLGSATVETRDAMAVLAARNVVEVLAGRPPVTPIRSMR